MEGSHTLHFQHSSPLSAPEMAAGGDRFVVEDLLDFCDEEEEEGGDCWCSETGLADHSTDDSSTITAVECCGNSISVSGQHIAGDLASRGFADVVLCGAQDDQAELEWLSNFVEESFSSEDLLIPNFIPINNTTTSTLFAEATAEISATSGFPIFRPNAAVPAKARSKRSRPVLCRWTSQLVLFSPSLATVSSPEAETFSSLGAAQGNKVTKMAKKTQVAAATAAPTVVRRCLHCKAVKTPQWRAGPMGPKTLCNACGVRYKSGRLLPEYRPAASPTFVPSKHSNSHRKVIELRRQKDLQQRAGGIASTYGVGAGEPGGDCLLHRGHADPDFQQLNSSCDGAGREVLGH